MNEAILTGIEDHALTPQAIEAVIQLSERDDFRDAQAVLQRDATDIDKRITRLVAAIESGGDATALSARLRELEARRKSIDADMRQLRPVPRLAARVIESRLDEWRRLLRASTTQARSVPQRVIRGRITFTPWADGSGYDFTAETRFDRLFTGIAVAAERQSWVRAGDLTGTTHLSTEDTGEADYGRILEAAYMRKGWRAQQDSNLRPPGS